MGGHETERRRRRRRRRQRQRCARKAPTPSLHSTQQHTSSAHTQPDSQDSQTDKVFTCLDCRPGYNEAFVVFVVGG